MRLRVTAVSFALAALALVAAAPGLANPRFDAIAPLEGGIQSEALAVSADGCVVVGRSAGDDQHPAEHALRWRNGVSSPLREDPDENPRIAQAVSPDGKTIGGTTSSNQAFVLSPPGSPGELVLLSWGREVFAFNETGTAVYGSDRALGGHGSLPSLAFTSGGGRLLSGGNGQVRAYASPFAGGWTSSGPAGGSPNADLWYQGKAALWDLSLPSSAPPQVLGTLPGDDYSEVRALSADGAIAVGWSGVEVGWSGAPAGNRRAFRWTAAGGIVALAPGTEEANGISANGQRVVGQGTSGAFLWDARRGARPLAQVLRDEYGIDVGDFQLLSATAISPDGKTFVGIGVDAEGAPRGWRARLREERCVPEATAVDLLAGYQGEPLADDIRSLAVDTQGRAFVGGRRTGNVLRVDPAASGSPPEELLDVGDDPGVDVVGVGSDDSVYVRAWVQKQLLRIRPSGAVEVVLDTTSWPPLASVEASPFGLAIAPDGTLFVTTWTHVLRIDPDGSVHELFDAATAGALARRSYALALTHVALGSSGHLFVRTEYDATLFTLDAQSGAVLMTPWRVPDSVPQFAPDPAGGAWLYGDGLMHVDAEGGIRHLYGYEQIPDGSGGKLERIHSLAGDANGNVYYTGTAVYPPPAGYPGWSGGVVRLSPDGHASYVLPPDTPVDEDQLRSLYLQALHVAGGSLYAIEDRLDYRWAWCGDDYGYPCQYDEFHAPHILRVDLAGSTLCTNGVDDDGDGLADFPDDPGCLSSDDDGERSFDFPCDNGVDDDADGVSDFPADPGCVSLTAQQEKTECDDGLDNDGDGAVDWDGNGTGPADGECQGNPAAVIEHPWYCGLGFEVALIVLPITQAARRWRRSRRARGGDPTCEAR